MTPASRAWLQMHFCVMLWGFTAIIGRTITLSAIPLVWLRMIVVTAALFLFPQFWKGLGRLSVRMMATYFGIGLVITAHWVTFYGAIKIANASVAATCMAVTPVIVALIEPWLVGRRFEVRELFFGIAVVPGVAFVVGGTPAVMRVGIAVGILSAFFAAIFSCLNKRFVTHSDAITVTGIEMTAGAIALAFISPKVWPSRHDSVLILILALACTLVPYVLSLVALRHLSAFSASLAVNMEPVYAIVLAAVFLREQRELTIAFYVGVIIILAAVFTHRPAAGLATHSASS